MDCEEMIPQCATCLNESVTIEALHSIWKEQEEFNTYFLQYQDAARKYRCRDFMAAFCAKH